MNTVFGLRDTSLYNNVIDANGEWARYLTRVSYPKGRIVYQPEDKGECLYLIHKGYARTYRLSPEGREVTFGLFGPGEMFGELALIVGTWHSAFAVMMEDAELYLLPRSAFEEMISRQPEIAYSLMIRVSERLRQAEDLIEDLVNRDVTARVARTLLQLADSFGRASEHGVVIDLRIPYQEIANMVGSTRETVTRSISQMQQNNWVRLQGGRLHLLDSDALSLLSE